MTGSGSVVKNIQLVIIVLALVGALVFVNSRLSQSGNDSDQPAQQSSSAQAKSPPQSAQSATILPDVEVFGNPATALHHIQVGWRYDSENQANQASLRATLDAVRDVVQDYPKTSAVVVDLDVPVVDRAPIARSATKLGITVDNKSMPALSNNPGEGSTTVPAVENGVPYLFPTHGSQ